MNENLGYQVDSSALAEAERLLDKQNAVGWHQSRMLNGKFVPLGGNRKTRRQMARASRKANR